jgi:hypothetical protein
MMKKNFLKLAIIIPALAGLVFMSSTPDDTEKNVRDDEAKGIVVENPEHDFGTILENGGSVTATFTIVNKTDDAIQILKSTASCGCTVATSTKEPIEPGQKGTVTATYNPAKRPGSFNKTVSATIKLADGTSQTVTMRIKGNVEVAQ